MANERPEYRVLRSIPDPNNPSRSAYREGELIHAQVVRDWGLQIGADGDVVALRPEQMARPAGNAKRADWVAYALAQDPDDAERIDGMSRDELRAEYGEPDEPADVVEAGEPAKGE